MKAKYYNVYPEIDFCFYMVKGTYEAVFKYGIARLKEDYNIQEKDLPKIVDFETGKHAKSYNDLLTIEEVNIEDFLDLIHSSGEEDYIPEAKNDSWILEHMDDHFTILNADGTVAKERVY